MTESAARAVSILRDGSNFQWPVITILVIVIYIYHSEIARKNWNVVFAGLALWGMDWFNEIWNCLVFHFTQYAPVWGEPGDTSYLILVGLNIETCLMFMIMGVAASLVLPKDPRMKLLGLPNRIVAAAGFSAVSVLVEVVLNHIGALTWDYPWWSARSPWLIFLLGYFPLFSVAFWVHDLSTIRRKVSAVGTIYAFDAVCLLIFGGLLGWF